MGIERMLLLLEEAGVQPPTVAPVVYAIVPEPAALTVAMTSCETLRSHDIAVQMHAAGRDAWGSMKSQFKRADGSGARFALIFGADELARGVVSVKSLRDAAVPQRELALGQLDAWAAELRIA